ncbi:hepatic and glial cell adhesion molecule-like [Brachionichthys hirsutus]|uniref:hepatic and glial cell adhesion molecule-like n=1 Tax=Brachionichthys hirsutus TaxID=412623 RepID=UPI003604495E
MAWLVATFGVIVGAGFIDLSAANEDACELYAAVGQSLTLPFVYEELSSSHMLRWTHNSSIIFYRQQGRISAGKPTDINATGSLLLKNLQFSSAGSYQANLLHPNGTLAKTWTGRLCLMDKVSKPKLTYNCDVKSSAVNLNCYVANPCGLVFSWELDGKTLTAETRQQPSISLAQLKGERDLTCSVENKISKEKSDTVSPTCNNPPPAALLCFASKSVLAVLVGGTGVILILLTAIIMLCCRYGCNKTQMGSRDNEELRVLSVGKQEPEHISTEYETMHTTESPPLVPEPSPRSCYKNVSQPEAQTESKQQLLTASAEGRQASPVPKPRTKSPYAPNV